MNFGLLQIDIENSVAGPIFISMAIKYLLSIFLSLKQNKLVCLETAGTEWGIPNITRRVLSNPGD